LVTTVGEDDDTDGSMDFNVGFLCSVSGFKIVRKKDSVPVCCE